MPHAAPLPAARRRRAALVAALALAAPVAQAGVVMIHAQGAPGEREVYFANLGQIKDRTPDEDMLADFTVMQIEVHVVYESASEADWAVINLQFRCPAPQPSWGGRKPRDAQPAGPGPMRIAPGGYRMTRDARQENIAPTDWQATASPMARQAQGLACNEVAVKQAEAGSAQPGGEGAGSFDNAGFNAALSKLGLAPVQWVLETPNFFKLRDIAWNGLWAGATRPTGAGDRPLTAAERAANEAEYAGLTERTGELSAQAEAFGQPRIEQHQAEQAFVERAAQVRGGRELTQLESSMLMVWLARPEALVAARLGTPQLTEVGELRLLVYRDETDNRSALVNAASGQVVATQGAHARCEVSFVTVADDKGQHRVADVRVRGTGLSGVDGGLCRSLLRTPED